MVISFHSDTIISRLGEPFPAEVSVNEKMDGGSGKSQATASNTGSLPAHLPGHHRVITAH